MLKGHTKIILTDVNTGEQEVHEEDNLITNALNKIINIETAFNHAPNNRILPIATNALGGIMLFDDDLTEDADNIHFPVEAHLVGYANTSTNTDDKYRGSWNAQESGKTADGYVSVWDFGTTQANGTIKSVARTHVHGGAAPLYNFINPEYVETGAGCPTTDTEWWPIRYDGEYLYMLKGNSSTHLMRLARVKIPRLAMGVADYSNVARQYEVIASWDTLLTEYTYYNNQQHTYEYTQYVYADNPKMYEDGGDGYIYCVGFGATNSYNVYQYDLTYFTIKYSDESYDKSATVRKNTGISKYTYNTNGFRWLYREYGHVHEGSLYMLGGNRKVIHIVPLNNVAAYRTIRIISDSDPDFIERFEWVRPHNGGLYFLVYHYTTSSYQYRNGILYPDGVYIVVDRSYGDSNHGNSNLYGYVMTNDDDLTMWGFYPWGSNVYVLGMWAANYLGTINNLASAITKTAAQTMKIIYTLTDVTE